MGQGTQTVVINFNQIGVTYVRRGAHHMCRPDGWIEEESEVNEARRGETVSSSSSSGSVNYTR